ncbi:hypothetical protein DOK76_03805 [Vagococcus sp. DIV0080]|uniref:Uncharacterized protein n=1 Tax=Candidatus Vagococcus giribetii TaxID=2230876 RepID=A0ABS3HS78_9ENTE|nr:hypothetical protein [Vagococcus sp. DIV0080]MBO0476180.1 hypothetical protein [Vagococcus sp. DIV0080]
MSKMIDLGTEKDPTFGDLENKVYDYYSRWDELIKGQISILEIVTDEGSVLLDKKGNVQAYSTSKKLGEVIKELEAIKKEVEGIERVQDFLYE